MSGKLIATVIILLVVIAGGYFILTNYAPLGDSQTTEATDQVQVQDVTVGEGEAAAPGSLVSVLYVGRLEDGTVFDSSEAYGNQPLQFVLGDPGLIPGFQIGINGMQEGGERVMAIPPSLGYGDQEVRDQDGNVIIPANSTLIFNVALVSVDEAPAEETGTEVDAQAEVEVQ